MRALQDKCVANEEVIRWYRKRQKIENKERDQYKEAIYILNEELTTITTKLKEGSRLQEEAKKAKAGLMTELATLSEQMDKAKADAMAEFRVSQPFIDACDVYYGDAFDDYLKQIGFVYPDLDLSKITLDDMVPTTPGGSDTVNEESDDSTHMEEQDLKDDNMVITQPILVSPITLWVSSAEDPSIQNVVDPTVVDPSPS